MERDRFWGVRPWPKRPSRVRCADADKAKYKGKFSGSAQTKSARSNETKVIWFSLRCSESDSRAADKWFLKENVKIMR